MSDPQYTADQLAAWAVEFRIGNIAISRYGDGWTVHRESTQNLRFISGGAFLSTDGVWLDWTKVDQRDDWMMRRVTFTDVFSALAAAEGEQH